MRLNRVNTLQYYTFDSLTDFGIAHGVFTRKGGVSPSPWRSLNLGGTVGDEQGRVIENRKRAFTALDLHVESFYDVWQVHGDGVICTDSPRPLHSPHLQADAILTDTPGVTLFMRFADCVPILLFDPRNRVIGLVHAGWLGTIRRVAAKAVEVMGERYGSYANDVWAAIGPSIAAHHYEVGDEVVEKVNQAFGDDASKLLIEDSNRNSQAGNKARYFLDLWSANQLILEQAGVKNIEIAGLCTACLMDDWYSHRGENGKTGRFGVLIAL